MAYFQRILFGSPGTGKSYRVEEHYLNILGVESKSEDCIKTVFHPEYTYGDFMGKLLPITEKDSVKYRYYDGHFLKALAKAYKNILDKEEGQAPKNVVLVIDEINRGNSSAIFGTVFQLLDRKNDGWSSYGINLSEMEFNRLLDLIEIEVETTTKGRKAEVHKTYTYGKTKNALDLLDIYNTQVKLPSNFSIIGTMNTSDNSIYYMDSAFKRRWEWEFIDIEPLPIDYFDAVDSTIKLDRPQWILFANKVNHFIKSQSDKIRKIEDKQIGHYFIKSDDIKPEEIRNKLMFFLWDSVFSNDKSAIRELINEQRKKQGKEEITRQQLVTFGDFIRNFEDFFRSIDNRVL